jgi:hypothetical protein
MRYDRCSRARAVHWEKKLNRTASTQLGEAWLKLAVEIEIYVCLNDYDVNNLGN